MGLDVLGSSAYCAGMDKRAKPKRLPKPVATMAWGFIAWNGRVLEVAWYKDQISLDLTPGDRIGRVRIVPVAKAKRRKGAK